MIIIKIIEINKNNKYIYIYVDISSPCYGIDLRQGGQGRPAAGGPVRLGRARSLHGGRESQPGAGHGENPRENPRETLGIPRKTIGKA